MRCACARGAKGREPQAKGGAGCGLECSTARHGDDDACTRPWPVYAQVCGCMPKSVGVCLLGSSARSAVRQFDGEPRRPVAADHPLAVEQSACRLREEHALMLPRDTQPEAQRSTLSRLLPPTRLVSEGPPGVDDAVRPKAARLNDQSPWAHSGTRRSCTGAAHDACVPTPMSVNMHHAHAPCPYHMTHAPCHNPCTMP